MTFRTNQPRSALASLSAFWEQSMQNRSSNGWILEEFHFERHDSFYFFAGIYFVSPPLSIDTLDAVRWPRLLPLSGGGSPHLHSHSMEEQLLNPHYNQSKFSPDRYMMMLNRDRDRERGLSLCWLFEKKHS